MNKMLCKDCPYFYIRAEYKDEYNWGEAVCVKHNLITDFRTKKKVETLRCIEEEWERMKKHTST